jgi:hypothetical protein
MGSLFVGDDWAEGHHDVHVMDEGGKRLASGRLPEELPGKCTASRSWAFHCSPRAETSAHGSAYPSAAWASGKPIGATYGNDRSSSIELSGPAI